MGLFAAGRVPLATERTPGRGLATGGWPCSMADTERATVSNLSVQELGASARWPASIDRAYAGLLLHHYLRLTQNR